MAKRYSVSPMLRPGAKTYSATFRNCFGARVTRSLETESLDRARQICGSLVELWSAGVRTSADVPVGMLVHPEANKLYFGERESAGGDTAAAADAVDQILPRVQREVERFPVDLRAELFTIIYEQLSLRDENIRLRDGEALLKRDLHAKSTELAHLKSSILGRAAETAAGMPAIADSVARFDRHIAAVTSRANAAQIMALVRAFVASLPETRATMMDVRVEDIGAWLDTRVAAGGASKRAGLRDAVRRRLGRFVNWCASEHDYASQMIKVPAVTKNALQRERGDIHWHELNEVERVIKSLPDDYWRALIAALAYAGLQLAELVWLRVRDVDLAAGRIWVTTVEDHADATIQHALKTAHRRRSIAIHPTYLLPRLKKFLKLKMNGAHFFFAMPAAMRRPHLRTVTRGSEERWVMSTLAALLLGRHGLKDEKGEKLPKQPGLLPAGMSAKSLRRTFGSLMLRSGKTTAEVAAAMGNTEDVVREHYARILGCEVDVDF